MKPINFKQANIELAKSQPQYNSLPAHKSQDGIITSQYQLSIRERIKILLDRQIVATTAYPQSAITTPETFCQ